MANGTDISLRARWSSQLPRVSQWYVRYQGRARDPRALIEDPAGGIGRLNSLSEAASRELRYISAHIVVDQERGSRDTLIRFEVGETSAAELQAVLGRRGGQIRLGATATRIQHNRRDVTAESVISFSFQS